MCQKYGMGCDHSDLPECRHCGAKLSHDGHLETEPASTDPEARFPVCENCENKE